MNTNFSDQAFNTVFRVEHFSFLHDFDCNLITKISRPFRISKALSTDSLFIVALNDWNFLFVHGFSIFYSLHVLSKFPAGIIVFRGQKNFPIWPLSKEIWEIIGSPDIILNNIRKESIQPFVEVEFVRCSKYNWGIKATQTKF